MRLYTDLDGSLITTKSGKTFPQDNDDWKFIPNILSSLENFVKKNNVEEIVILTNQAGIDEGYHRPLDVIYKISVIADNIRHYLILNGVNINVKYEISTALSSPNRKPYKMKNVEGWMIGDASGIEYSKEVTDETILKTARKKADLGEFRIDDKLYRVVPVDKKSATILSFSASTLKEEGYKVYQIRKDFSDSDKVHAELNGLKYIDYENFIEQWKL